MKLKTKLNYKSFFSTNHKDNLISYSSFFLLIYVSGILLFIYFNSLKYYAVSGNEVIGDSLENIERFLSEETIHLVNKDLVIANNHELIAKKLFNDLFAEEFHTMITKYSQVDPDKNVSVNEFLLNSGGISEIFVNLHPNSSYMSGYTFNTFTEFNFISKEDAKNIAAFEANDIFPQAGIFDSIKTNLNYISEKIGFGDLFSTVETAKSEYIKTRIEEILLEQDNNFMETLETNMQNRYALRKNLKEKGASISITMEDKSKYYEYMTLICEALEYKHSAWGELFGRNIMSEDTFAKASQYTKNLSRFPFTEERLARSKRISKFDFNNTLLGFFINQVTDKYSRYNIPEYIPPYQVFNQTIEMETRKLTMKVLNNVLKEIITIPKNKLAGVNIRQNFIELSKTKELIDHPEIVINLFNHFYETKEIIVELPEQAGAFHGPELKNESNSTILAKD